MYFEESCSCEQLQLKIDRILFINERNKDQHTTIVILSVKKNVWN